jgi:hypothetical protein
MNRVGNMISMPRGGGWVLIGSLPGRTAEVNCYKDLRCMKVGP